MILTLFASCAGFLFVADATARDRLLVVAPESFKDSLESFRISRSEQLGTPVGFLSLEAVRSMDGVDDPERLKRELFRRWKAGQITAVLIVGDADVMPMRFMVLDRGTTAAFDTAFYPSDLYYADLAHPDGSFDDWNAMKEGAHGGYFGEVHGETNKSDPMNFDAISYEPEIAVGRWPVSSPAQASEIANKTIRHQSAALNSTSTSTRPIEFLFSGGWIDNRSQAQALCATAAKSSAWSVNTHAFFLPDRVPSKEVATTILQGTPAAIFHTGHGQPDQWEGCLDRSVLASLPRTDLPPLLFSIGCSTAEICTLPPYQPYVDVAGHSHAGTVAGEKFATFPPPPAPIQSGALNTTSIAESAVRESSGGAIAVIGCVTGSQPSAHTLLDGFVAEMVDRPSDSIGVWWCGAVRHYVQAEKLRDLKPTESWYPASIYFQGMKFILLGDPTVRLFPRE